MSASGGTEYDIAVIGGGPAGLAAAIAAAVAGFRTVIFAPPAAFPPGRTAALLQKSVDLLTDLGVWPSLIAEAAPLRGIRIVNSTERLIRAPEVTFWASEISLPAFGYNIPNAVLVQALLGRAEALSDLRVVREPVSAVTPEAGRVALQSASGECSARLVVAADGARSLARQSAGIDVREWTYGQSALVATLTVAKPHNGVSTEFHTENGPFTLVPLPGKRMSLVWVDRPATLEAATALSTDDLGAEIERRSHSIHGAVTSDSVPAVFPLSATLAERYAARRTILIGEAAHRFPPIGAQGLNLGYRDVAALSGMLIRHRDDPGSPAFLDAYHAARQSDIRSRTLAVDLLNRSLLTDFLPVQAVRGLGLSIAASVPIVRRLLMRQGLAGMPKPRLERSR